MKGKAKEKTTWNKANKKITQRNATVNACGIIIIEIISTTKKLSCM